MSIGAVKLCKWGTLESSRNVWTEKRKKYSRQYENENNKYKIKKMPSLK